MKKLLLFSISVILIHLFTSNISQSQWEPDVRLTNDPAGSYTSYNNAWCIAANGNLAHVVWEEYRDGNAEIYYKHSTNSGVNWGEDVRLTNDFSSSCNPSVSVYGSLVHVVWEDVRDGNLEIYYKRSTDDGINWGTDTRLTNNNGISWYPSIAVSGSLVNVIWYDNRDGNWEIYYKRNPTGNAGIQNISTEIPSAFSLEQNYPNPFNPVTKIRFDIAPHLYKGGQGGVSIKIYDILGKEIQTLVNEHLQPGTYEVTFDGSNLPSGVYFYQLRAGDFIDTKKLVLIK